MSCEKCKEHKRKAAEIREHLVNSLAVLRHLEQKGEQSAVNQVKVLTDYLYPGVDKDAD
jgi:hypothetical protein